MVVRLSAVRLYKSVTIRKIRSIVKSNRNKIELDTTCPEITHGALIKDRKSSFQGHVATARSIEDVAAVVTKLLQNKKIHAATHNILAYRIERTVDGGTTLLEDSDDDGEAQAGGKLLRLLQLLDQRSTVVVVTRWFGGIQLGPDRFRHIHDAAKMAIEQAGLLQK